MPDESATEALAEPEREPSCLSPAGRLPVASSELDSFGSGLDAEDGRIVLGDSRSGNAWPRPVRIYARRGERWVLEHSLESLHLDEIRTRFGRSVAVGGERIAATVTWRYSSGTIDEVELHRRDAQGKWELETVLRSEGPVPAEERSSEEYAKHTSDSRYDMFAALLELDGGVLAAAGTRLNAFEGVGLRVFERGRDDWTLAAAFEPLDAGFVPGALALGGDRIALGAVAPTRARDGYAGAVLAYRRGAEGWREERRWMQLASSDRGRFGESLAWTPHGLAVGSPGRADGDAGAVFLLAEDSDEWAVRQILVGDRSVAGFGTSLAARDDVLVTGAPSTGHGAVIAWRFGYDRFEECGRWTSSGPARGAGVRLAFAGDELLVGLSMPPCPACKERVPLHGCEFGAEDSVGTLFGEPLPRPPPLVAPEGGQLTPLLLRVE